MDKSEILFEKLNHCIVDIYKTCFEEIGYNLGETYNEIEYHNFLIDDPIILKGSGEYGEGGYYSVSDGISIEAFNSINVNSFKKYASGGYLNNILANLKARTINFSAIPKHFIDELTPIAKQSGVPLGFFILLAASESGFRNSPTNSAGYGGYFGNSSQWGYSHPLSKQAELPISSYKKAKNCSPGAGKKDLLMLGYIYHHLPAVGCKYWKQTKGKIYSLDPEYIRNNILACYSEGSATRLAEAITVNISGQYLAEQISQHPEYM